MEEKPLYLVMKAENELPNTPWEIFLANCLIIFKPFDGNTWLVIMFGMVPFLAIVIMIQERGVPQSNYNDSSTTKNIIRALYLSLRSMLMRFYEDGGVQTNGGAWTVLAFCFIGMIGMSLYTAQMASFLTQQAQVTPLGGIEEAIKRGYTFCGERKSADSIMKTYNIEKRFLVDPVELGGTKRIVFHFIVVFVREMTSHDITPFISGDGKAGFNCKKCNAGKRILDHIDPDKANHDSNYCHAAIVPLDIIELEHSRNLHCNKTVV